MGCLLKMLIHFHVQCIPKSDPRIVSRRFHPGLYSGRLNRVNDVDTSGLEFFWSCCGEYDHEHPGCKRTRHASYDDP